jgi:rod shape-determining protein MreD
MAEHAGNLPARVLASLTPALLAAAAVVLVNLPVSFTGGLMPAPVLTLVPIYFWALARPDLMPPYAVLLLGLAEDLMSGGPPGIWATGFLVAYALAESQREMFAGLEGPGAVLGFAAAMFTAAGTAYLLVSLVYWRPAPLAAMLLESAVTVLFYPFIAALLGGVHRKFVGADRGGE